MIRYLPRLAPLVFSLVAAQTIALEASSEEAHQDAAVWMVNQAAAAIDDRFSLHLMIQNRWTREVDRYERTVFRPWLAIRLPEGFQLDLGYDAHLFRQPRGFREDRAWQRIGYSQQYDGFRAFTHFWLEERFFESDVDPVAWRGRLQLGAAFDLPLELTLTARNELFFDLNDTPRIRSTGLGENHLALALSREIVSGLRLDVGYLMQYVDRRPDVFNHTVVVGFAIATPPLATSSDPRDGG